MYCSKDWTLYVILFKRLKIIVLKTEHYGRYLDTIPSPSNGGNVNTTGNRKTTLPIFKEGKSYQSD